MELGSLSKLQKLELSRNHLKGIIPVSLSNLSALDSLYLKSNNLYGDIPLELGQLSSLEIFQVSENNLSGTIPPQLFNISSITSFAVAINKLDGTIPPNIDITLPNLQILNLGGNMFHGLLPNSISNVSGLSDIDVIGNQFTGPVPPTLGRLQALTRLTLARNRLGMGAVDDLSFINSLSNCSQLKILMMDYNNLSGQLPDSIANLSIKLTILYMGGNRIFGHIPSGIQNLVSLNGLIMDSNQLTGSIPVSIGKLSNLLYLSMSDNQLSGQIPSTIGNITQVETIYLDGNRLQGAIPPSLSNCGKLRTLWLSRNQLVGSIPKQLIGLSSLSNQLVLSWNHLTGNLPIEVGNLEKIVFLGLSNNRLSGKIPESLEKCLGLQDLYLQGNLFEGVIPQSLQNVTGIQELDLSGNRLSGRIPEYLESFNSLRYLNLSSNDLEGEVPKQGIFKNISAFSVLGNDRLCGGISKLHLPSCPRPGFGKPSKPFPRKRLLLIILGVGSLVIFLCSFLIIWFWRRKAANQPSSPLKDPLDNMFQKVSYKELLKATDGFSAENLVGVGSYGSVYKGLLMLKQETTTIVAVKVLDLQRRGASKSFMAECEAMRCIRHRNLVKMFTSCSSIDYKGNEFKALVFEFMPNGSLEDWLYPTTNDERLQRPRRISLNFMERLHIAIDVASALDYLHNHCQTPIIHCDLKPSNVLLGNDMHGHVGDFGLAKFLGGVDINFESEHHTNSTSVGIRGSIGYAAPEYGMGGEVSTNGDVYSYGIMVLEMYTGKRPTDGMFMDGFSLHTFVKSALISDQVMQIVDPIVLHALVHLDDGDDNNHTIQIDGESEAKLCKALTRIFNIGVMCSVDLPRERMEMIKVVKELQLIKNLYQSEMGI